jgi:hypothetical protein
MERASLHVGALLVRAAVERPGGYLPGETVHGVVCVTASRDATGDTPVAAVRARRDAQSGSWATCA